MSVSNLSTGLRPGVCLSTSRPTVPYEGQMIYETDTDKVLVWNGSAWFIPYASAPLTVVSRSTTQTIASTTQSHIAMDTEAIDVLDWHSTVTNTERITPTIAGWYMCIGSGSFDVTINARALVQLFKNTLEVVKFDWSGGTTANGASVSQILYLNGSTDYVRLGCYQASGSSQPFINGSLQVVLLRSA